MFHISAEHTNCIFCLDKLLFAVRLVCEETTARFYKRKRVFAEGIEPRNRPGSHNVKGFTQISLSGVLRPRVQTDSLAQMQSSADFLKKGNAFYLSYPRGLHEDRGAQF